MELDRPAACEEALGYTFSDPELLRGALIHSSAKMEANGSNERLEFLGDAVLGMAISEHLYQTFPDHSEGELTKIKSVVVSRKTLARVSNQLGLGDCLHVGRGIAERKALPRSLLANVFEAVVAAIYLDGGLEAARDFIVRHLAGEVDAVHHNQHERNYKSMLQQYSQHRFGATPVYRVLKEEGPDHVKMFHVATVIQGKDRASGWGNSKKQAEQRAAKASLDMLQAAEEEPAEAAADG